MKQGPKHPLLDIVADAAAQTGVKAFAVGGFVRDFFLNRPCKDIDIVVLGDGIALANLVSQKIDGNPRVTVFKTYGTAMLKAGDMELEFVGARKESYSKDSRNPVVSPGSLEDDQNRRDFTINALAISMNPDDKGALYDPFSGMEDLNSKIIRTPLEPGITFSDDPLRMMRAIRFASQLNFTIEPVTLAAIREHSERIKIVSQERITDELNKIVASKKPSIGFKHLFDTGLLHIIFPELVKLQGVETIGDHSHKDNFYHTLQVLDNVAEDSDDLWLRWAAILHDIAKPQTKRYIEGEGWTFHGHEDKGARMVSGIFRRLRLPLNEKMKFVENLVLLHLRPIVLSKKEVTDSAVRRLIVDAGDNIDALLTLCKADITSKNEVKVKRFLKNLEVVGWKIKDVEERDRLRNWQPPITGNHIMDSFHITDPKQIGELKSQIREAILEGTITNDEAEAFEFMLHAGEKLGLHRKDKPSK